MGFSVSSKYKLQISKDKMANGQFQVHKAMEILNTLLGFLYKGFKNMYIFIHIQQYIF